MKKKCPICNEDVFKIFGLVNRVTYRCMKCNHLWDQSHIHYQSEGEVDINDLITIIEIFVNQYLGKDNKNNFSQLKTILQKYNLEITDKMKVVIKDEN